MGRKHQHRHQHNQPQQQQTMNNNEPIEVKAEVVQPPQPIEPKAQVIGKAVEKAADKTIKGTKAIGGWFKAGLSKAADKLDRKVNKDKYPVVTRQAKEDQEAQEAIKIVDQILKEHSI